MFMRVMGGTFSCLLYNHTTVKMYPIRTKFESHLVARLLLAVPEHLYKPIVENSFCTFDGRVGLSVGREGDQRRLGISLKTHLDVDDFAELGEMVVEVSDVVEASRDFFQLKRAVGREGLAWTEPLEVKRLLVGQVQLLRRRWTSLQITTSVLDYFSKRIKLTSDNSVS